MSDSKLAEQVYCGLIKLSHQGSRFQYLGNKALRLTNDLGLDISTEKNVFSKNCKQLLDITSLAGS